MLHAHTVDCRLIAHWLQENKIVNSTLITHSTELAGRESRCSYEFGNSAVRQRRCRLIRKQLASLVIIVETQGELETQSELIAWLEFVCTVVLINPFQRKGFNQTFKLAASLKPKPPHPQLRITEA